MPGVSITWNDGAAASLSDWAPGVGTRACAVVPDRQPIGQSRVLLGSGATRFWPYRDDDHTTSLELRLLPVAALVLVNRLRAHLIKGGTIALDTGDGAHVYPMLGIAPGSTPELRLADPKQMRYTLSLRLLNVGTPDAPIEVAY